LIEESIWIRTAVARDCQAIHAILQASWHEAYDDLIGKEAVATITADWYDPVRLVQEMSEPQAEYIVADDGTELFGVAHALSGAVPGSPDSVLIRQLCVHPSHQNQGLGKKLLEEIESCFPAARRFRVQVMEKNERALQFFSRRLYERVEVAPQGKTQNPFLEITLEKEIR